MKFTFDFKAFTLDLAAIERDILKDLRFYNKAAGQHWLKAVWQGTPIPVWSGASRATFQKLASALGTSIPIGYIPDPDGDKIALGRSLSEGSVEEDKKEMYVGFRYGTSLRHLHFNEYNLATAGPYPRPYTNNVRFTPYKFQSKAAKVWREYAKKVKLSNPYDFLKTRPM